MKKLIAPLAILITSCGPFSNETSSHKLNTTEVPKSFDINFTTLQPKRFKKHAGPIVKRFNDGTIIVGLVTEDKYVHTDKWDIYIINQENLSPKKNHDNI